MRYLKQYDTETQRQIKSHVRQGLGWEDSWQIIQKWTYDKGQFRRLYIFLCARDGTPEQYRESIRNDAA